MSAVEDLTELVERAAAAERAALAAKWEGRSDVDPLRRLARSDAGEAEPEAATVDGHVPLAGRNAVSRDGPALARRVRGEIARTASPAPDPVSASVRKPSE